MGDRDPVMGIVSEEARKPLELGGHGSAKWVDGPPPSMDATCASCGAALPAQRRRRVVLDPVPLDAPPETLRGFSVCSEACAERLRAELG